jgi:hypothetical protein
MDETTDIASPLDSSWQKIPVIEQRFTYIAVTARESILRAIVLMPISEIGA